MVIFIKSNKLNLSMKGNNMIETAEPLEKEFPDVSSFFADWFSTAPHGKRIYMAEDDIYVKERGAINPVGPREKVGRNEPCPCLSGRKFKRCCGK